LIEYFETPKPFNASRCKECGTCLSSCPVMKLPIDDAKREIVRLKQGEEAIALKNCTSCLACDLYCPEGANPAELILQRWREINLRRPLPIRAKYFLPHARPNFRTYAIERMSKDERSLIESWKNMSPANEVCYPGCNMIVTPHLTRTKALRGLEIRGSLEVCCGEMYWRMGLFDHLRQAAKRTTDFFRKLQAEKVVILCTAGYFMFKEVLPHFGGQYNFSIESYLEYLRRRTEKGELKFPGKLEIKVTIQDSCYGKQFGDDYMNIPRQILSQAGCSIVEMENSKADMLCCGIGAGFSPSSAYNPIRMMLSAMKILKQARSTGAQAIVTYCSGCLQMLSTASILYPLSPPIYHILEIIEKAMGGEPEDFSKTVAMQVFKGVARNQFPVLLSRRRFSPPHIDQLEIQ